MSTVITDNQIVPFGTELMKLFATTTGDEIVRATRTDGVWTITASGEPDMTADNRPDAIAAMAEQALAVSPGTGCSTLVPNDLAALP
ncbi:hypothetical protein [Mycolicibacterium peregrinum]|uniref:hypothetical protein n=1 Tax=Mycolicibacterium peregrinum TaxID=43304 RepID=UPI003AAC1CA2